MNERIVKTPKRCGAKTRAGSPCRRWSRPNGRCNLHGGKSKHGIDAPNFKTGRYSAYVPDNLATVYDAARADPDLLSLRDNVALVDARIAQLLGDIDNGGAAGQLWENLIREWAKLLAAIRADNATQQGKSINVLNAIINDGAATAAAWNEITGLTETRRRAVDTEQRVVVTRETMVSIEAVLMYLAIQIEATKSAVQKYVDEPETRSRIIEAAAAANRQLLGASTNN